MQSPYYKYNLYDFNQLRIEIDSMYDIVTNLNLYTKTLYRGFNRFEHMKLHSSFEEANNYVSKILEWHDGVDENDNITPLKNRFGQLCFNGGDLNWKEYPMIHDWIINKSFELFKPYCNRKDNFFIGNPLLTLYRKGCLLGEHKDGKPDKYESFPIQKPANILIYFNKDYKKEYGGLFKVENEELIPSFCDIVFLNFAGDSDPSHMVTEVIEDVNRFALLLNVQYNK